MKETLREKLVSTIAAVTQASDNQGAEAVADAMVEMLGGWDLMSAPHTNPVDVIDTMCEMIRKAHQKPSSQPLPVQEQVPDQHDLNWLKEDLKADHGWKHKA